MSAARLIVSVLLAGWLNGVERTAWSTFSTADSLAEIHIRTNGELNAPPKRRRESTRGTGCFSPTEGNTWQDRAPGHHVPCAATGSSCVKVGKNSNPMKLKLKHLMLALNTAFEQLKIKICFKFWLDFQFLMYQLIWYTDGMHAQNVHTHR